MDVMLDTTCSGRPAATTFSMPAAVLCEHRAGFGKGQLGLLRGWPAAAAAAGVQAAAAAASLQAAGCSINIVLLHPSIPRTVRRL